MKEKETLQLRISQLETDNRLLRAENRRVTDILAEIPHMRVYTHTVDGQRCSAFCVACQIEHTMEKTPRGDA